MGVDLPKNGPIALGLPVGRNGQQSPGSRWMKVRKFCPLMGFGDGNRLTKKAACRGLKAGVTLKRFRGVKFCLEVILDGALI